MNSPDQRIQKLIEDHKIVLFMKGIRRMPQCGFSARVVEVLDELVDEYHTVNILTDPELREAIKSFSNWPTIPQLYVDGTFLGGCDIVNEMYASGELHKQLGIEMAEVAAPTIHVSASACKVIRDAMEDGDDAASIRVKITPDFQHNLVFAPASAMDVCVIIDGLTFVFDRSSAGRAEGLSIDFETGSQGSGFRITNPNQAATVKEMSVQALKEKLDAGEDVYLIDVRPEAERKIASIDAAKPLTDEVKKDLESLDRNVPIIFHCHHGGRSRAMAEAYLRQGFRNVNNLVGGVDAWSTEIDPTVPRY